MLTVSGQLVDVFNRTIFPAALSIEDGKITAITHVAEAPMQFLLPGFVDAHIHIESSMLAPSEFAKIAITHGTVATVSDPHEIANVCGVEGVLYMLENAAGVPLKFNFGAPSCVPATSFETAGAEINAQDIALLLQRPDIKYLAEMMNFPGVLYQDKGVMDKLAAAKAAGKPIDGHAPGLRGEAAQAYIGHGISTDHECTTLAEALDKLAFGMKILIREGSAAKNYTALSSLLSDHPQSVMFCSDDKHPDELVLGHINKMVSRAVADGYPLFDVLYAACVAPVTHYGLDVGLLKVGDAADFVVVSDLEHFQVKQTYINGALCWNGHEVLFDAAPPAIINHFKASPITVGDLTIALPNANTVKCPVIEAIDGQLITTAAEVELKVKEGELHADVQNDILKIGVVNRYKPAKPALGFIKNFGLQQGALASSVAHDSHNIVFVGVDDESICNAVNAIISCKGGISVAHAKEVDVFALPIAGLMTDKDAITAAKDYERLDAKAKALGSKLKAPFMTLSFMALPVIPKLKITDFGLFDVDAFSFTPLFPNE